MLATLVFFVAVFIISTPSQKVNAAAGINHQINFQGKLVNPDGTNVTDGTYSIVFSIYSVASAGSAIWTETQGTVTVSNGIFQVNLGSVTTLPGSIDFNTDNIYLGIKVGADAEMTPRIQFTAVPQAFNSEKLNGLASSAFAQLAATQTFTGANTFQPTTNITGVKILQNSSGSFGTDVFNVQGSSGGANNFIQITSTAANQGAVTIASLGANNLNLNSGSNTVSVGATNITGTGALTVAAATGQILDLESGSTANLNVGTSSNNKTINIGAVGATANTTTVNIATSTGAAQTVNIGSSASGSSVSLVGDVSSGNRVQRSLTRTLPTTVNDEVDIGSFALTNGGGNFEISVVVPNSGFSVAKQYELPIQYNQTANAWVIAQPISDSGPYSTNDFALDVNVNVGTTSFRLRRVAGATAGTAYVTIVQKGVNTDTFTASAATSSVAAPSTYLSNAFTTQTGGILKVQGSSTISSTLGVTGNTGLGTAASSSVLTLGTNTTTAAGGISFGTDTTLYRSAASTLKTDGTLVVGKIATINNPTVGAQGGIQLATSYALTVSGDDNCNGDAEIFQNVYSLSGNDCIASQAYKYVTTHGSFGNRGIRFGYQDGITFYADNLASTANATATLTPRMTINNSGQVGIGATPANGLLTVGTNTTTTAGGQYFGTDTNLYRSAASTLKTDGTLTVGTNLNVLAGNAAYFQNAAANATAYLYNNGGTGQSFLSTNASRFYANGALYVGVYSGSNASTTGLGVLGNSEFQGALYVGGAQTNSSGGQAISFNGATSNYINFNQIGVGAPTFTTRSAGTKTVLYDGLTGSSADYALGINTNTLWNSVPTTSQQFQWYGGTTVAATLSGSGNLSVVGNTGLGTAASTSVLTVGTNTATAAGGISFGTDTNLYRSAANQLSTSSQLVVNNATGNGITATGTNSAANTAPYAVYGTLNDTATAASSTGNKYASQFVFNKNGSAVDTGFAGGAAQLTTYINAGTLPDLWNTSSRMQLASGGTVTRAYDFVADAQYGSAGAVGTRAGLNVRDWNKTGTQTLTNQYGILIDNLTSGTSNYSIFTGTAQSWLGGNLTVAGTTLSQGALTVGTRDGSYTYSTLDGLRISGDDISNTIYNGAKAIVISADSGNNVSLCATSNCTNGLTVVTSTGQVQLPATGSSAGLLIGGDATLYRSGANALTTGGALTVTGASTLSGNVQVGATAAQTTAILSAVNNGNSIEFGHTNSAGYRSTIGAEVSSGKPFLAFSAEAGTTNNTYRTRGNVGTVIQGDIAGGLLIGKVATASADNQALTTLLTLSSAGNLGVTGTSTLTGNVQVGSIAAQSDAIFSAVKSGGGNSIEFGHNNTAGYHSTLGAEAGTGKPFLAFSAEAGSTTNTYRTRGLVGTVIQGDIAGGLVIGKVATASADNQSLTTLLTVSSAGNLGVTGTLGVTGATSLSSTLLVQTTSDSASALLVKNNAGTAILTVDTLNKGTQLYAPSSTSSLTNSGTNWIRSPKHTVTAFLGDNDSTVGYTASESSANLRFNGLGVAWGDFGYYPQGGGNGNNGNFRFSTTGAAINTTPNAKVGVGDLYVAGNAGIGTTSPGYLLTVAGNAYANQHISTNASGSSTFYSNQTGDGSYRWTMVGNGTQYWGDGTSAGDVTLARNGVGGLTVKSTTNSATAFQVQNSSSESLFAVDTTNRRVTLSDAGAATANLLVLDSSSAAPTGVNGGMYYDTTLNRFRCYQNSTYIDCTPTSTATVRAYNNANISVPNGTFTALTFNSERIDTDTMHSTSSNTDRLTATTAGFYQINGAVVWDVGGNGYRQLSIQLNGGNSLAVHDNPPSAAGSFTAQTISTSYYLNAGDYVKLVTYQNNGGALNALTQNNSSPEFSMTRLDGGAAAAPNTLQNGYDSSSSPATITTTSNTKDVIIKSGSGLNSASLFQVQNDAGTALLKVDSTNNKTILGGDLVANGASTATTGTSNGAGNSNTTGITLLAAGSFANGDVIFVDNTGGSGQDYYTRIISGGGTTSLVVSPAVSYGTNAGYTGNATITKYNVQSIGSPNDLTNTPAQSARFFQGFFLGGVVTGAGSTTLSDNSLLSSGQLVFSTGGANPRLTIDSAGASTFSGSLTVAGATNITNITQITDGVAPADTTAYGTFGVTRQTNVPSNTAPAYIALTRQGQVDFAMGINSSNQFILGAALNTAQQVKPTLTLSDGVTSLTGTLGVSGATTLSSTLNVGGVIRSDNSTVMQLGLNFGIGSQQEFLQLFHSASVQDWSLYRPGTTRDLAFWSGTTSSNVLYLSGSGKLGIGSGISSPAYQLEVVTSGTPGPSAIHVNNSTADTGAYVLGYTSGGVSAYDLSVGVAYNGTNWIQKDSGMGSIYAQGSGAASWYRTSGTVGGVASLTSLASVDSGGTLFAYGNVGANYYLQSAGNNMAYSQGTSYNEWYTKSGWIELKDNSTNGAHKAYFGGGNGDLRINGNFYPGNGNGGGDQTSWYIRADSTYGLWSNTGIYAASLYSGGGVVARGGVNNDSGNLILSATGGNTVIAGSTFFAMTPDTTIGSGSICFTNAFGYDFIRHCTSSARYKHNIQNLGMGLDEIRQLRPVRYTWNQDGGGFDDTGLIAEEVADVNPIFVEYDNQGRPNGVRYDKMISLAFAGIQELDQSTTDLQSGTHAFSGLNVAGAASVDSLAVTGATSLNTLNVSGATSLQDLTVLGSASIANLSVSGATTLSTLHVTSSATFDTDITVGGHVITAGDTPVVTAQASAGTGATVTTTGNDTLGTITIQTGSNPTAGELAKLLYKKDYGAAPKVLISPANDNASQVHFYRGATSVHDFGLNFSDTPAANTTYQFDYYSSQ